MDLGLAGRGVVVTAGSRGLGLATARVLAAEGAHLLIAARDRALLEREADLLGPLCSGVPVDLADPAAATTLLAAARDRLPSIDGLLINVGGPAPAPAFSTPTSNGATPSTRSSCRRSGSPSGRRSRPAWRPVSHDPSRRT